MPRTQLTQKNGQTKEPKFADISVALLPVIRMLRQIGCCPLKIRKNSQLFHHFQMQFVYSFKLISFPTIYTIVLIFIYVIASLSIIIKDVYFGKYRGLVRISR